MHGSQVSFSFSADVFAFCLLLFSILNACKRALVLGLDNPELLRSTAASAKANLCSAVLPVRPQLPLRKKRLRGPVFEDKEEIDKVRARGSGRGPF